MYSLQIMMVQPQLLITKTIDEATNLEVKQDSKHM
jgi:hypothetical protein